MTIWTSLELLTFSTIFVTVMSTAVEALEAIVIV